MSTDKIQDSAGVTRRLPIIAAMMSMALPGFGQLYNGRINRAIWFFIVFNIVAIPLVALIALYLPARFMVVMLAISLVITLGVWVWGIADAWRDAKRLSGYRPKPWQTSGLYVIVFLLCNLIVLPFLFDYVRSNVVQPFRIPSNSMAPTVQPGDFIFTDKRYNCPNCRKALQRGDVAVFVFPNRRNLVYIKRIIGLPGDVVTSKSGVLSVTGSTFNREKTPISEQISVEYSGSSDTGIFEEKFQDREWSVQITKPVEDFSVTVKPGHVFVLGDNRSASNDSRTFGQVPLADVIGRARQIWFSMNSDGIQWSRMGKSLHP